MDRYPKTPKIFYFFFHSYYMVKLYDLPTILFGPQEKFFLNIWNLWVETRITI